MMTENNKEKKITYDFEPFKPINHFLYRCDNKFHLESLDYLFSEEKSYGFIIMDGHGCLFAKITGQNKEILTEISVDLPNKHRRGGQSSVRFARIRIEKRHNYLTKITELTTSLFITNDMPNVSGLIIGGSSDFKKQLSQDDRFDQRLKPIILSIVDIQYGGERGLYSALKLSADVLKNTKFVKEQEILINFFEEVSKDSGLVCYGFNDVMYALTNGVVDKLVLYEDLKMYYEITEDKQVICKKEGTDENLLIDYLIDIVKDYGAEINLISDVTSEGHQFAVGFEIGAFLRYKIDMPQNDNYSDEDSNEDEPFI